MKRSGILNRDISRVLSSMGHTDTLAIADCGLPVPSGVECIDLALCFGEPRFIRTLELVLADMKVEKVILAEETAEHNPTIFAQIQELFAGQSVAVECVSHEQLKAHTRDCRAVIRTGEATPYANIILQSACIF